MSTEEDIVKRKLFLKLDSTAEDIIDFIDENPFDDILTVDDIDCQINKITQRRSKFHLQFIELDKLFNDKTIQDYTNVLLQFVDEYVKGSKVVRRESSKRNVSAMLFKNESDSLLFHFNNLKITLLESTSIKQFAAVSNENITNPKEVIQKVKLLAKHIDIPLEVFVLTESTSLKYASEKKPLKIHSTKVHGINASGKTVLDENSLYLVKIPNNRKFTKECKGIIPNLLLRSHCVVKRETPNSISNVAPFTTLKTDFQLRTDELYYIDLDGILLNVPLLLLESNYKYKRKCVSNF